MRPSSPPPVTEWARPERGGHAQTALKEHERCYILPRAFGENLAMRILRRLLWQSRIILIAAVPSLAQAGQPPGSAGEAEAATANPMVSARGGDIALVLNEIYGATTDPIPYVFSKLLEEIMKSYTNVITMTPGQIVRMITGPGLTTETAADGTQVNSILRNADNTGQIYQIKTIGNFDRR